MGVCRETGRRLDTAFAPSGRPLRDADIRAALLGWLRNAHRDDVATAVYEELRIPRPTARADVVVVNGALVGYEIKSDVDSIRRIGSQAKSYGHVFDRIYLVTTNRRESVFSEAVPTWWGIIRAKDDGTVRQIRPAKRNRAVSSEHVLYLLQVPELKKTAVELGAAFRKASNKSQIIEEILRSTQKTRILQAVRQRLKERKARV